MTTLSQLVQDLRAEVRRADVLTLADYVNQVVRELHADPKAGGKVTFFANMQETELTASLETGYVWQVPRVHLLQDILSVYFASVGVYATEERPNTVYNRRSGVPNKRYYYLTGDSLAFGGYGGLNGAIQIAYFQYPRGLLYYASGAPATWDATLETWSYDAAYVGNEEQALELTTNWILQRHTELVRQGTRAKIFANLGDTEKARSAYSMYMGMRTQFVSAERYIGTISYG